jgi:serine/threonine-protein kinase
VWPWLALLGILAVAALLVWLFVLNRDSSKGKVVPAVVGMQQQQAIAKLTGEGFDVRALVGPASKPAGIVVAQKPGGGSQLDKGQTVVIDVSNGHALSTGATTTRSATTTAGTTSGGTTTGGTTTAPSATAGVPNAVGQDAASGAGQVEAAGFVAETDPVSAAGTPGSIVQEDPAAGTQAGAGSIVRLSVAVGSNRPAQNVPDVTGRKAGAARAALLDATLTVKTEYEKGPAAKAGSVLTQSPAAGASVPAYTQVTIVVGE